MFVKTKKKAKNLVVLCTKSDLRRQDKISVSCQTPKPLTPQPIPLIEQMHIQAAKKHIESHQNPQTEPDIKARSTDKSKPEPVYHVHNRIKLRHDLPDLRKLADRVKNSSEIGQGREHKSRNNRYIVESFGKESVEKPGQGEKSRRQNSKQK